MTRSRRGGALKICNKGYIDARKDARSQIVTIQDARRREIELVISSKVV